MKNIIRAFGWVAVSLWAFTACEDEHYSVLPTFGGFRFEPTAWHSDDSVTVTAVQQNYGDLIYKAKYTWRVQCAEKALVDTVITVVYDNDKSDPRVGFRIPADMTGTAEVSFKAEYSYSSRAPKSVGSGTNDGNSGLFGNIRTTGSGELYGLSAGTVSKPITARP